MIIRNITAEDEEQILNLAKEFFDDKLEKAFCHYDRSNASNHFKFFVNNPSTISICAEDNGKIVGMICGIVSIKFFCSGKTLQEIVWFVSKKHRAVGIKLLLAMEKSAKIFGCEDITMVGMEGDKSESYYLRSGYKKLQSSFIKRF